MSDLPPYPREINDELWFILSRPNFWCGIPAQRLREKGHSIPEKSEAEQAEVLHWMLCMYFEHGDSWRERAADELGLPHRTPQ